MISTKRLQLTKHDGDVGEEEDQVYQIALALPNGSSHLDDGLTSTIEDE